MDYHGITSIGKIYIQRVSTLPIWSITDIARVIYTNDNANFYLAGDTEWREIIDGTSDQTIIGIKTFSSPPLLSRDPSASDEAVRLSYLEANYTKGTIDLSNYVTLDGVETITGKKTFSTELPESNVTPVDNDDLTNKSYVDTVAPKVLVSSTDATLNYLYDKLTGGSGISVSKLGADGFNQQVQIAVTGFGAGNYYSDLPVGTIIKFAGSSVPEHYLECDGSAISRTTYEDLFAVIGEDYGSGDGTTTFNIPSCTGDNCGGEMWCVKYEESEMSEGLDERVKVSGDDTTAGYLEDKLIAGAGISLTTGSPGGNETYTIASAAGASSTGMWLKSTGGNNCTVKAGSVVINNVVFNLTTDGAITLTGNMRDGELELASTVYYLYAVGVSGTVPTFKFSTSQPTKNKYGTTVSFAEECGRSELYHPTEGLTWRYIGEVYNNSSSNILAFDKMYPGYWESGWITNPYTYYTYGAYHYLNLSTATLNHGLAVLPNKTNFLYAKTNSSPTTIYPWQAMVAFESYYDTTTVYDCWGDICHTINSQTITIVTSRKGGYTTSSYAQNPYYSTLLLSTSYVRGYINYIIEK